MELQVDHSNLILFWQVVFPIAACIQLFYLFYYHARLAWYKAPILNLNFPPVSIVIAARNEYDNLAKNLPAILEQDYPNFEVVVVNDGSWDDSEILLAEFQKRYPNLKVAYRREHEKYDAGKKLALTLGIKAAVHDRLLLTDADCRPKSRQWIKTMAGHIVNKEDLVLGYSPFEKRKGFLNALIRFEGVYTAMNYFGFALAGNPYMGVGRNLSYSRSSFFQIGGFKKHYSIPSGDDDLLVNQIANGGNTRACLASEGAVETTAKASFSAFWRQKRRHLYTGRRYRLNHKVWLILQPMSYLFFVISGIALLVIHTWLYIVLAAMAFRVLVQILIFRRSSKWLGQGDLVFLAPFLEVLVVLMSLFVHIANASAKPIGWKKN